ncbi:MAG: hypothetical protein RMK62_03545 [Armatimonadota bacterium]|nr:hypothetical protein [Armatimonadota bacterium]
MKRGIVTICLLIAWVWTTFGDERDDYQVRLRELGADPAAVEAVVATLRELLEKGPSEARVGALDWLLKDPKARDPSLAPLILQRVHDQDKEVRWRAIRNLRWLSEEAGNGDALQQLIQFAQGPDKSDRLTALAVIRQAVESRSSLSRSPAIHSLLLSLLRHSDGETAAEAIRLAHAIEDLKGHPQFLSALDDLIGSDEPRIREAVSQIFLARLEALQEETEKLVQSLQKAAEKDPALKTKIAQLTRERESAHGPAQPLLVTIPPDAPDLTFFAAFVQPALAEPLREADGKACVSCHQSDGAGRYRLQPPNAAGQFSLAATLFNYQATLPWVRPKGPGARSLPQILQEPHGGVGPLWAQEQNIARQLFEAWVSGEKLDASIRNLLDFRFFVQTIQPLLVESGEDKASCAQCHNTHAVFNIRPPAPDGTWTLADARHNYASALKVVNPDDPMGSLLVKKPISAREGSPDTGLAHAGGIRWSQRKDSPQWRALAQWVSKTLVE